MIILLLTVLFVTGCGEQITESEPKIELDKFKIYLNKNNDYECKENVCEKVTMEDGKIRYKYEINFENNIFKYFSNTGAGKIIREETYNWVTNISTHEFDSAGIKMSATYNHITNEFDCNNDYIDQEYSELQCQVVKKTLKLLKNDFEKIITESGTTYFNN